MPKHARWRLGPGPGLGPLAGPARLAQASATTELVYTGALIWGVGIYLETKSRIGGVARVRWYIVRATNVI